MVAVNRTTKMLSFINHRIRATIVDGRQIVGRFVAFDRHMNLVLADSEEFRKLPKKKKTIYLISQFIKSVDLQFSGMVLLNLVIVFQ